MRHFKVILLFVAFAAVFAVASLWLLGPPPWKLNAEMLSRGRDRAALADQAVKALVDQAAGSAMHSTETPGVIAPEPSAATVDPAQASDTGPTGAPTQGSAEQPGATTPEPSATTAGPVSVSTAMVPTPSVSSIDTMTAVPSPTVAASDTPSIAPTTAVPTSTPAPVAGEAATPESVATLEATMPPTAMPLPPDGLYTVQDGDTLASIAARYGSSVEALLAANGMDSQQFIWLGQRLRLPVPGQSAVPRAGTPRASPEAGLPASRATVGAATESTGPEVPGQTGNPVTYTVRPGDYLSTIAKAYNTTVAAIAAANSITNPSYIEVGMQLVIPSGGATPARASGPASAVPVVPTSAAAAQPSENTGLGGKIVFLTASGQDIYVIGADGSGLKRLTVGLDPELSSDGQRVVFARWGEQEGIYTIKVDGTGEALVYSVHQPRQPAWSPDGSQIAFSFQKGETTTESRDKDGKTHRFTDLFWRVAVVGVDGQGFTELPCKEHSSSPTWSKDGKYVVFAGDQGLTVSNASGFYRELTHGPWHLSPAVSPDGSRLVFMIKQADHFDLFLRPVRDLIDEQTSLTSNKGVELAALTSPPRYADKPVNNVAPAWSPDGTQIVFLSDRDGSWQIYAMDADGSNQHRLFESALGDLQLVYDFASERSISWGR